LSLCDFCRAPQPAYEYPARDFAATITVTDGGEGEKRSAEWRSQGAWLACEPCAELIDAGEYGKLTVRADKAHDSLRPEHLTRHERDLLRGALIALHEAFAGAREGPAVPLQ
jgi:hypothetical protein